MNNWLNRIPQRYWGYLALCLWGALTFQLLHKTPFGIDEGAARSLLLIWSVVDQIANPVVTLGVPDFRVVFLAPIGYLWTGSLMAAKVFSLLLMAAATWTFHTWRQHSGESESALLASGLLLISPLVADQIDTISVGPYLLLVFGLGAWLDRMYREKPLAFGGIYFTQMLLCLTSVTLHPAGLAYPAVLAWSWYKQPLSVKQQKYFVGGISTAVIFALFLTSGWRNVTWLSNPLPSLADAVAGPLLSNNAVGNWIVGGGMLAIMLLIVWRQRAILLGDLLGRTLIFALVVGALAGDATWGMLTLATCLYWGLPLLLRGNKAGGFLGQRGVALILVFALSTLFMFSDKTRYQLVQHEIMPPNDQLIKTLVEHTDAIKKAEEADPGAAPPTKKSLRVASQWPGRTMVACRCDTLPLPPPVKNEQALLAMLRGINFLIFDPQDIDNRSLVRHLALLAGETETVSLEQGGVIVQVKKPLPVKAQQLPKP